MIIRCHLTFSPWTWGALVLMRTSTLLVHFLWTRIWSVLLSWILVSWLRWFPVQCLNVEIDPNHSVESVTGIIIPALGSYELSLDNQSRIPVIESAFSIIGLDAMGRVQFWLLILSSWHHSQIRCLILRCSKASVGIKLNPLGLKLTGSLVLMKRCIIPPGLREPANKSWKDF